MRIGIIGTGSIGGTLARKLVEAGHDVRVANSRGADAVKDFADQIGATATDARAAVAEAEVIILSIPFSAIPELPDDLFDGVPANVPVIDTGNYYPGMRDPPRSPRSTLESLKASGYPRRSGVRSSRPSTISWPIRSPSLVVRKGHPTVWPSRWPGMMPQPSRSPWASSPRRASIRLMPVPWQAHGVSILPLRPIAATGMQRRCVRLWPQPSRGWLLKSVIACQNSSHYSGRTRRMTRSSRRTVPQMRPN